MKFALLIWLVIVVLELVSVWRVFQKAGQPGWACLIPIYNTYIILKIVGREAWWLILFFIPFVNIVVGFIVFTDLAKAFGKGTGFGVGLVLLSPIFIPILGLGKRPIRWLAQLIAVVSMPFHSRLATILAW